MALQGPAAAGRTAAADRRGARRDSAFWFAHGEVAAARATIARTGYTGEDGFEMFVAPEHGGPCVAGAARIGAVRRGGAVRPRRPGYAAARGGDASLRQRHRRVDHGARSRAWAGSIGWSNEGFIGRERLMQQKAEGVDPQAGRASRWSIGASPATGIRSFRTAGRSGVVTSGTQTPFLKKAIGMAYVPVDLARSRHGDRDRHSRPRTRRRASCRCRSTNEGDR